VATPARSLTGDAIRDGSTAPPASAAVSASPRRIVAKHPRVRSVEGQGAAADFDKLLVSAKIAMLLLDRQLRIVRFTPAATALFSLLPADIGRPIADLSQKFVDSSFVPDVALVLEGSTASKKEVQSTEGRWYIRQTLPHLSRNGTVEGVVVKFSDVAADAIQEARLYAESIVNTVREPLLVLDDELHLHSINQPFSAMFGVTSHEVLGRALQEIGAGVWEVPGLLPRLHDVLDRGVSMEDFEVHYQSEALGVRELLLNARTLHRGGGRPDLILMAIEDVTDRRRVATLLHENESRRREEEHVRQRQLELTNALRVSTVGELATGLAHELNQPLSSISNMVEACARYVRSGVVSAEKLLELLDEIAGQSMRAAGIVAHLRSFVEKGEAQLEPVDLIDVVRNVPHLMLRELERTRVVFEMDLAPGKLPVLADRIQIEQVVVNLIQNAMDSIQEADGPERIIHLRARACGAMAEVSVHDSGTGVSGPAAESMFEPFFTTKARGLGMGLALSRSILEAHHGRIWMETPKDGHHGVTVHFTIPLKAASRRKGHSA
jgi:two-component system, chemotaxis family, CheB/CheR fusion protein